MEVDQHGDQHSKDAAFLQTMVKEPAATAQATNQVVTPAIEAPHLQSPA